MTDPTPAQLAELRQAAKLSSSLPEINVEIDKMIKTLTTSVYQAIRKGELTPTEALAYWMEMYSYERLRTRLEKAALPAQQITKHEGE
jgi:hypothetical protein